MKLSARVEQLKPSPTLSLNQLAKTLAAEGKSIVNLTAGEPDFPTPARICKAATTAMGKGETKYTPTSGIPQLRKAVAETVSGEYGRNYSARSVIITAGAKQAIFNVCFSLLNPGDEAVILAPYWVSYVDIVGLAGGKAVVIPTEESNQFLPEPAALEKNLSDRTKILFLNSPSNPTGAIYSREVLEEIARIIRKRPHITVITDDIYGKLAFDRVPFVSIGMMPELPSEQLAIVGGVSKTYSMTGWRIGYALAPEPLVSAMDAVQSQVTSNATSIAQWAALEALAGDQKDVPEMCKIFEERRNFFWQKISKVPGITCHKPGGAFFLFPNVRSALGKKTPEGKELKSDIDLSSYLLEKHGLAVVPGSAFGAPGHLRLSYSSPMKDLEEGVLRFTKGITELT